MSRYVNTSFPPITDAGRLLLAAATAAAERSALGLSDLTDEDTNELAHANTVCAFTYPSTLWRPSLLPKIGTLGSDWTALAVGSGALGNSGKGIVTSGVRGGANSITTGASASSSLDLISTVNGLALYGGAIMDDLVAATSKWHLEFVAALTTTPDAQTEFGEGFIDPGGSVVLLAGIRGASSITKFRLFKSGTSTGVNSTVNWDGNPHRFRVWANGDGLIYFSVDNETPVTLSTTWGAAATPYVHLGNGTTAAAQTANLWAPRYRTMGMVA